MPHKLLIVDDEHAITNALNYTFTQAGYQTTLAHTGQEALQQLASQPDLVVLDIMLPDMDGYEVCQKIRQQPLYTPILMLTAKEGLPAKLHGLDVGADAYLTKPYVPRELLAQVRALLRLAGQAPRPSAPLTCGPLTFWPEQSRITLHGRELPLTKTEHELLALLIHGRGQVVGRQTLLRHLWAHDSPEVTSRTVDTHIQRLRAKIEAPHLIQTVRGFGYRLLCDE